MPRDPDSYTQFDAILDAASTDEAKSPWKAGGLACSFDLLDKLIAQALRGGVSQNSGSFAKAFDCWCAFELRRAGFPQDAVWPRQSMPRVLSNDLVNLIEVVTPQARRAELRNWLATNSNSPKVAPTEAKVLGGVYRKQADVLVSDWAAGIEVMISTKSMLGSYGKNLRNRFEESFGDAINLRQRFPLGAFGFLFAIDTGVQPNDFVFLDNMLRKLVDSAGYDATCLVVVDLDKRKVVRKSKTHNVPDDLSASRMFETLVSRVIDRTPADRHARVREKRGMPVDKGAS